MKTTVDSFIGMLNGLEPHEVQGFLDPSFYGGCPCFNSVNTLEGKTIGFDGDCWRLHSFDGKHQYLGVFGTLPKKVKMKIAKIVKKKLDAQKWYHPYKIVLE